MNDKESTPPMRPSQQGFERQVQYDLTTKTFTVHCAVCGWAKQKRKTWLHSRDKTILNLRREFLFCDTCGKWVCDDCFLIDNGKGNSISICTACASAQGVTGLTSAQFEEAWPDIQRPVQKRLEAARRSAQKSKSKQTTRRY